MRDFDPARRGLFVREWRAIDRVQYAVARHVVGRNAALVSPVVRVGDKELAGVGGAKLAAEWAGALRGKRRTGCGPQMGVIVDAEAVNLRGQGCRTDTCSDASPYQVGSVTIEEYVANHGSARQCEGRILQRTEVTIVELEPSVAAECPAVTDEDQIIVDRDGDGRGTAG